MTRNISSGLGGKQRILDIGGVPYLIPLAQKDKLYDMKDYPTLTNMDLKENEEALIIGAGAAPWTYLERNAEVYIIPGIQTKCNRILWHSYRVV